MNRALFIIMIPVLLVTAGYIVLLRTMGIAPGYPQLIAAIALIVGVIYGLARQSGRKAKSSQT